MSFLYPTLLIARQNARQTLVDRYKYASTMYLGWWEGLSDRGADSFDAGLICSYTTAKNVLERSLHLPTRAIMFWREVFGPLSLY